MQRLLNTFGDHVHAHGVSSRGLETDVEVGASKCRLHRLQACESAGGIEGFCHNLLSLLGIEPNFCSSCSSESGKANTWPTCHAIACHHCHGTATCIDCFAPSTCACH